MKTRRGRHAASVWSEVTSTLDDFVGARYLPVWLMLILWVAWGALLTASLVAMVVVS